MLNPTQKSVAVITYNGLCTFEFGIAVEIFGLPRPEFNFPWYDFSVVAAETAQVSAVGGVSVTATKGLEHLEHAQTIIIPGWRDRSERPSEALLHTLNTAHQNGARFLSICSGVFVLAAAGLLKGKRATTHWQYIPDLKQNYPDIDVIDDVLYTQDHNVMTSAGSAAGIDAALHLVRQDYGSQTANTVAKRLVMSPHRDGGQAQYVTAPVNAPPAQSLNDVMGWARKNISRPIGLTHMARHAKMGERTFQRRFKNEVGTTPMAWLQRERMFHAQALLETTDTALTEIALQCGYESLETFRVAFRRCVGTSPAAYRSRFKTPIVRRFGSGRGDGHPV